MDHQRLRDAARARSPHERRGQALSNALFQISPAIANEVVGSDFDPFYLDERIPAFWAWLEEHYPHEADEAEAYSGG